MVTPGQRRQGWRYRKHEAGELYHAEMREFIAAKAAEGLSIRSIAATLEVSPKTVREYLDRSVQRINQMGTAPKVAAAANLGAIPRRVKRGNGAGPHVRGSTKSSSAISPVLIDLHQKVWELRKRMLPFDEIAILAGITEQQARNIVKQRLSELDTRELQSVEQARALMVAQIDDMIRAVVPDAIGKDLQGNPARVDYKAVDKMLNLMDAKAKLMGLNSATHIDLTIRLKQFAEEHQYDYREVEDVAAEVLAARSQRSTR